MVNSIVTWMKHGLILDYVARQNQLCWCGQMSGGFIGLWCGLMDSWIWKSSVLCQVTRLREERRLRRKNSSRSLPEPQPMAVVPFFCWGFPPTKKVSEMFPPNHGQLVMLNVETCCLVPWFFLSNTVTIQLENLVFLCVLDGIGRKTGNQMWLENPSKKWRVEWENYLWMKDIPLPCLTTRGYMFRCIRISIWY